MMTYFNKQDLQEMSRVTRLKLINTLSGIKPANLIGTVSGEQKTNLAIFSSVVHLGSDPALLGFILRPNSDVRRHTYENILETGVYTINHVHESFIKKAHYTSAKFPAEVSEFERCKLNEYHHNDFAAPYVEESPIKIGMKYKESIEIKVNGTILVIGEIEQLLLPENAIDENGLMDIGSLGLVGIGGLNSYYGLSKQADFPYARVTEVPDF